jgi:hypothetical protein
MENPVKLDRLVSPRRGIQPKYCENFLRLDEHF